MKYTSAEAAKLLRRLNEEMAALKEREGRASVFIAALEEKPEEVRPDYDFAETQRKLDELERKVRLVKHAVNSFNLRTEVPGFGLTVDQMLVYIPQLSERKRRLSVMANRLPKERARSVGLGGRNLVEYQYTNYDVKKAEEALLKVTDELARAQTALDVVNNSIGFEIGL